MIADIIKFSAEEIINGNKSEAKTPACKEPIDYARYDTDRDFVVRFSDLLPYSKTVNTILNQTATEYEGESYVCPKCGKHLDLINNDGNFCKFCGQEIYKISEEKFGDCIKEMRLKNNYIMADVADALKVSVSHVYQLESGGSIPTKDEIINLSKFYGCSVNQFFGQPIPRRKGSKYSASFQEFDRPTLEAEELKIEDCPEGYDNEYIYKCPFCHCEVNLTIDESLTLGLDYYEITKERSEGNDGLYCKHCGQALKRPVKIDPVKVVSNFDFWLKKAEKNLKKI